MATMRHGLSDFLMQLAAEPDLYEQYRKDRSGTMERAGLGPHDQAAVLSDELPKIRTRLRREHPDVDVFLVVMPEPEPPEPKPEPPEPEPPEPERS
jgi:hypothetical protein